MVERNLQSCLLKIVKFPPKKEKFLFVYWTWRGGGGGGIAPPPLSPVYNILSHYVRAESPAKLN